jgi:hypothetical protein
MDTMRKSLRRVQVARCGGIRPTSSGGMRASGQRVTRKPGCAAIEGDRPSLRLVRIPDPDSAAVPTLPDVRRPSVATDRRERPGPPQPPHTATSRGEIKGWPADAA